MPHLPLRRRAGSWAVLGCLLWLGSASAQHTVVFNFLTPSGAGNRTDGGFAVISWADSDPHGFTNAAVLASRRAYSPFQEPDAGGDLQITTADFPVSGTFDSVQWDTSNLPAGCYQPYAILRPEETFKRGSGNVTVYTAGQNVPPSVWITNQPFDQPSAAGLFTVHYQIDEPDDLSRLTLKYLNGSDETTGVIASSIPIPKGGGVGSVVLDVKTLPNALYFLYAEVTSDDGRSCDVYSSIPFNVANPYDLDGGVIDGGPDDGGSAADAGGSADAGGFADAGGHQHDAGDHGDAGAHADGGHHGDAGDHGDGGHGNHQPKPPSGCGCGGAPGGAWLGLLGALALRTRRARQR